MLRPPTRAVPVTRHVSPGLLVRARPLARPLAWHIVRLRSNGCEHISRALNTRLASPCEPPISERDGRGRSSGCAPSRGSDRPPGGRAHACPPAGCIAWRVARTLVTRLHFAHTRSRARYLACRRSNRWAARVGVVTGGQPPGRGEPSMRQWPPVGGRGAQGRGRPVNSVTGSPAASSSSVRPLADRRAPRARTRPPAHRESSG